MKKVFKAILKALAFITSIPHRIEAAVTEAVDAGVVDFSGQGRDKYGR